MRMYSLRVGSTSASQVRSMRSAVAARSIAGDRSGRQVLERLAVRLVVLGSLNVDHTVWVERLPEPGETVAAHDHALTLGGKGLNQAVTAARQGAAVAMVGCVGDDEEGDWLVQ